MFGLGTIVVISCLTCTGTPPPAEVGPARAAADTLAALGAFHGRLDGRELSVRRSFLSGVGLGLVAGPVGGVIAVRTAGRAEPRVPAWRAEGFDEMGAEYRSAYLEGLGNEYDGRRREASMVGAMLGTIGFAFVVLQLVDLPARASLRGDVPDPDEPVFRSNLVTVPFGRF